MANYFGNPRRGWGFVSPSCRSSSFCTRLGAKLPFAGRGCLLAHLQPPLFPSASSAGGEIGARSTRKQTIRAKCNFARKCGPKLELEGAIIDLSTDAPFLPPAAHLETPSVLSAAIRANRSLAATTNSTRLLTSMTNFKTRRNGFGKSMTKPAMG